MEKMKKGRLARRAKSFKEDIIDILSNLRSPSGANNSSSSRPSHQSSSVKPKPLPINSQFSAANGNESKNDLLCIIENLPSSLPLNQHFTNEINKNIMQVKYALKFYEEVVMRNTLELVPSSASVVLETVFNILTTLGIVFPAREHSSSLISATNLVHQALSQLIRWSDDILLQSTASNLASSQTITDSSPLQSEVRTVVDGLKIAVNDLVQIVIHKAANKTPPPSTPLYAPSNAVFDSSHLRLLTEKDAIDGLLPPPSPKRMSKSSDGSFLEDVPSTDWSSDSLPEEPDQSPPPKPPLPLKGILSDFVTAEMNNLSVHQDPCTPPPLPPKKRSLVGGGLSPMAPPLNPFSAMWSNPLTLPDLVPSHPWLNESFDSIAHHHQQLQHNSSSMSTHETFERQQNAETRWEEHRKASSTSVFSSSSSSSFTSYGMQQQSQQLLQHQQQHHHQQQKTSASFQQTTSSSFSQTSSSEDHLVVVGLPPALPVKRRQRAVNRLPSQYDNLEQFDGASSPCASLADFVAVKQEETSEAFHFSEEKRVHSSTGAGTSVQMRREFSSHMEQLVTLTSGSNEAPPLPPKKRHIKAYMEMVGPYSQPSEVELFRQTMEAYYVKAAQWQEHTEDLFFTRASSYLTSPPLLPPKRNKHSITSETFAGALVEPPPRVRRPHSRESLSSPPSTPKPRPVPPLMAINGSTATGDKTDLTEEESRDLGMERLDLSADLVLKQPGDDGPEVRGGGLDALITHAAKLNKDDYLYQAAFLTTYRTFIMPLELTRKLIHRFNYFLRKPDISDQRAARNAFSLLVGVVDDLALSELEEKLMRKIIDFQSLLVSSGDLVLAKALRSKFLEKCTARRLRNAAPVPPALSSLGVSTRQSFLLDFKAGELAEQMTLLDAELFLRIEIPEVLVWAQEQNEEKSPNLTLFTEHFNKMSYWARSRILEQTEARDRERYVIKFIKIMKHLRRLNNFNSYLALLSALDSAPVRRLEWQKSITDGLQEYCALIDSSSSFRAYRQALAETQPPCIPYIGLILQDLTFVHIGNPDTLSDSRINFGKRWQQFHILENMRRFQKCHYLFKRNDRIVAFFNEFNDFLCEESMWQISESIRPRGSNNGATKK